MKPIPTWQSEAGVDPGVRGTYGYEGAMQQEIDALRTRLAEVEKDAMRYQAIRNGLEVDPDNSGIVVSLIDDFGGETLHGDKADAAIDAAMKEQA